MPQHDLVASIKSSRKTHSREPVADQPVEAAPPAIVPRAEPAPITAAAPRPTDEPTRPLGTRVAVSVHDRLNDYVDRANKLARKRGVKRFTQREIVERALQQFLAEDPAGLF